MCGLGCCLADCLLWVGVKNSLPTGTQSNDASQNSVEALVAGGTMFSRSLLIKLVIGCLLGSLLAPALFVRAGQPALSIKTYLPTIINTQITSPNLQTLLASYVLAPVPRYSEAKYIPRGFSAV